MKKICLTQGFYALVDDEDYERLAQYKWYTNTQKNRHTSYAIRVVQGRTVYMHRVIMNASKGLEIDHINGNGLDNRRENLRICSRSENQRNSYKHRNGKPLGVYKMKMGKYVYYGAQLRIDGKTKGIGSFKTQKEAVEAFNQVIRNMLDNKQL